MGITPTSLDKNLAQLNFFGGGNQPNGQRATGNGLGMSNMGAHGSPSPVAKRKLYEQGQNFVGGAHGQNSSNLPKVDATGLGGGAAAGGQPSYAANGSTAGAHNGAMQGQGQGLFKPDEFVVDGAMSYVRHDVSQGGTVGSQLKAGISGNQMSVLPGQGHSRSLDFPNQHQTGPAPASSPGPLPLNIRNMYTPSPRERHVEAALGASPPSRSRSPPPSHGPHHNPLPGNKPPVAGPSVVSQNVQDNIVPQRTDGPEAASPINVGHNNLTVVSPYNQKIPPHDPSKPEEVGAVLQNPGNYANKSARNVSGTQGSRSLSPQRDQGHGLDVRALDAANPAGSEFSAQYGVGKTPAGHIDMHTRSLQDDLTHGRSQEFSVEMTGAHGNNAAAAQEGLRNDGIQGQSLAKAVNGGSGVPVGTYSLFEPAFPGEGQKLIEGGHRGSVATMMSDVDGQAIAALAGTMDGEAMKVDAEGRPLKVSAATAADPAGNSNHVLPPAASESATGRPLSKQSVRTPSQGGSRPGSRANMGSRMGRPPKNTASMQGLVGTESSPIDILGFGSNGQLTGGIGGVNVNVVHNKTVNDKQTAALGGMVIMNYGKAPGDEDKKAVKSSIGQAVADEIKAEDAKKDGEVDGGASLQGASLDSTASPTTLQGNNQSILTLGEGSMSPNANNKSVLSTKDMIASEQGALAAGVIGSAAPRASTPPPPANWSKHQKTNLTTQSIELDPEMSVEFADVKAVSGRERQGVKKHGQHFMGAHAGMGFQLPGDRNGGLYRKHGNKFGKQGGKFESDFQTGGPLNFVLGPSSNKTNATQRELMNTSMMSSTSLNSGSLQNSMEFPVGAGQGFDSMNNTQTTFARGGSTVENTGTVNSSMNNTNAFPSGNNTQANSMNNTSQGFFIGIPGASEKQDQTKNIQVKYRNDKLMSSTITGGGVGGFGAKAEKERQASVSKVNFNNTISEFNPSGGVKKVLSKKEQEAELHRAQQEVEEQIMLNDIIAETKKYSDSGELSAGNSFMSSKSNVLTIDSTFLEGKVESPVQESKRQSQQLFKQPVQTSGSNVRSGALMRGSPQPMTQSSPFLRESRESRSNSMQVTSTSRSPSPPMYAQYAADAERSTAAASNSRSMHASTGRPSTRDGAASNSRSTGGVTAGRNSDSAQLGYITNGANNGAPRGSNGNVSLPVLHNNQTGGKVAKRQLQPPAKTSFNNRLKFLVSMNDQNGAQ